MKHLTIMISLAALTILFAAAAQAQDFGPGQGNGVCQFIDEDGDGFNDLAPDADGDGIPNGMDPDYVKPEDGTGSGNQYKWAYAYGELVKQMFGQAEQKAMGVDGSGHWGPGDGTGECIGDGTGGGAFGPGAGTGDGTGDGTGTGSEGGVQQQRKGRR